MKNEIVYALCFSLLTLTCLIKYESRDGIQLFLRKWTTEFVVPNTSKRNCAKEVSVVQSRHGFPSYCDFDTGKKIQVTWDKRSLILNGERALFLSGSIHGPRFSDKDWPELLDKAVEQGFNAIQVYVIWNSHQQEKYQSLDWSGNNNLAKLISLAAKRGLFVNLRLGPYVCGEWTYGALPIYLGLEPGMEFRTYNKPWMEAMGNFSMQVTQYIRKHNSASQGGPIIMAQIENELSIADDPIRGEAYVAWCGDLAMSLEPDIAWMMCNGETAHGLINSCNGQDCVTFLSSHGQNGQVLKTQPALWTELEGGYQIWGESSSHPSDYFWGDSARTQSYQALRWFERGGSHVNLYMWAGGSNFGPSAAAGITQAYAFDAAICANGIPHEPKFDHFAAMFSVLADHAYDLLSSPALLNGSIVEYWNGAAWLPASQQQIFFFSSTFAMIESDYDQADITVRFINPNFQQNNDFCILSLAPLSVAIINPSTCTFLFDSGRIAQSAMEYRRVDRIIARLRDEHKWSRYKLRLNLSETPQNIYPIEQSRLCLNNSSEQYALYETMTTDLFFTHLNILTIESERSMAFVLYIDKQFIAAQDEHSHAEGHINFTFTFKVGTLSKNTSYLLSIISENLGYHNLIGRWGASRTMKQKGLLGSVFLNGKPLTQWRSTCGIEPDYTQALPVHDNSPGVFSFFSSALFFTTTGRYALDAHALGRGHLQINGHDLGRFWNITRDSESRPTQRYYYLPQDWLFSSSVVHLTIFDALGGDPTKLNIIQSTLHSSPTPMLPDEVDSPASCLE